MTDLLKPMKRPSIILDPVVPESGRVWSVDYDEINRIPAKALLKGDLLVARREGVEGFMVLQAVPDEERVWHFEDIAKRVN